MRLRATHEAPDSSDYLRPGGPWDVETLDTLLTGASASGTALVDDVERLTSDEVEVRVSSMAGGLRSLGVGAGDVVAWQLPNWTDAVLLARASWRLGAIAAPLHHRAGSTDLAAMIELVEPAVVLSGDDLALAADPATLVVRAGDRRYAEVCNGPPVAPGVARGADLALVQFTSGSTGTAKAVLHTHRSLAAKAVQMVAVHGLGDSDATLVPAPIAHISGMLNGVLVPGAAGMRTVLMERWDSTRALELIEAESVSFMIGPPSLFLGLIEAPGFDQQMVASLRLISTGATGVTPEFVRSASERLGAVVKRSYGCTEAPTVTTSAGGDPADRAAETDGRARGGTRVRVVDPTSGEDRPPGATGEVWVRGPELFAGYALEAQTVASMSNGWFRTGDLGQRDSDGWLTLVGRTKDLIIRGGENIAPSEVERVLEQHPDVRQAVVVGVEDPRLGERVAAFVVGDTDLDRDGVRRWFETQGIARFKAPEVVVHVDELPLLSLGKPDRSALRRRAQEMTR